MHPPVVLKRLRDTAASNFQEKCLLCLSELLHFKHTIVSTWCWKFLHTLSTTNIASWCLKYTYTCLQCKLPHDVENMYILCLPWKLLHYVESIYPFFLQLTLPHDVESAYINIYTFHATILSCHMTCWKCILPLSPKTGATQCGSTYLSSMKAAAWCENTYYLISYKSCNTDVQCIHTLITIKVAVRCGKYIYTFHVIKVATVKLKLHTLITIKVAEWCG